RRAASYGYGSEGGQGAAAPGFGGGDVGQGRLGDLDHFGVEALALGADFDRYGNRCRAGLDDGRVETEQVADEYRLLELEGVDGHRGNAPGGAPGGRHRAGDVGLGHDPAAEDVAMDVGVGRHRHDAQDGLPAGGQRGGGRGGGR